MRFKALLLSLLLVTFCACKNRTYPVWEYAKASSETDFDQLPWIKFQWAGFEVGNNYQERGAMIIPVNLEGLPHSFSCQFDTGARRSELSGNSIQPYLRQYPNLKKKKSLPTTREDFQFRDLALTIQDGRVIGTGFFVHTNYGKVIPTDSIFTETTKRIGTIGVSICKNKVLIIDYPKNRLCLIDHIPEKITVEWQSMMINDYGMAVINANVGASELKLLFDTGSSIFPVLTSNERMQKFSRESASDTLVNISSWGQQHHATEHRVTETVSINNRNYDDIKAYAIDKKGQDQSLDRYGVDGITGNILFWNDVIIVDFKNAKFGIVVKNEN